MVNVSVNDVVNVRASCLSLSMSACRQRWIFLRVILFGVLVLMTEITPHPFIWLTSNIFCLRPSMY